MNQQKIIEFFDRLADGWDENLCEQREKMEEILDAARIKTGDRVLDIACGTGVMFPYYLARGAAEVTGADIAPRMLEKAGEKFKGNREISLLCADAMTHPFEEAYDVCMVFNAFPHFDNPKALFENLYRALKKGGTLTVAHDRGRAAIDAHHEGTASEVSCGLISAEAMCALMKSAGFTPSYTKETDEIYIVTATK